MPAGLYFYPRPPRGGRPAAALNAAESLAFLSTPSARRATPFDGLYPISRGISIHALREEGDTTSISIKANEMYFYPRPPRGGRHRAPGLSSPGSRYFYPRPPRGGRPAGLGRLVLLHQISIHALREEGDVYDPTRREIVVEFLSTPSARRATAKTEKNISAFVSL